MIGGRWQRIAISICLGILLWGCQQETVAPPSSETTPQIQGQQTLVGDGVSLSVPATYVGGNPNTDLDELEARLSQSAGDELVRRLRAVRQNLDETVVLVAIAPLDPVVSVNVTVEPMEEMENLLAYVSEAAEELSSVYQVETQAVFEIAQRQTGVLIIRTEVGDMALKQLIYTVERDDAFWNIVYTAPEGIFQRELPIFERSFASLSFE